MIDYPSTFTDEDKNLYLEYLSVEILQKSDKSFRYDVGFEKYQKIHKMLEKLKAEENYRDKQRQKMISKLKFNFQKQIENKNYFKKFQR